MKMTGAQAMVLALKKQNVSTVFGYPGAAICPFYDALYDSDIMHILTRHEQGAAHAANGYSRASGRTGVCVATSGPGATNLLTGIATAYLDSIPLVAITGQVETSSIGKDVFQEVDITGACEPFIKYSYLIRDERDIPRIFREAFHIASTGRPGPVLIDVPSDIQKKTFDAVFPDEVDIRGYRPAGGVDREAANALILALRKAQRPVICAGGGVISSKAQNELRNFSSEYDIPIVTTLMGIGSVERTFPLNLGMLGSHGVYAANYAIHHADLIIVAGARIGDRAMGKIKTVRNDQTLAHIDIDEAEIGKNARADISLVGDAKEILAYMLDSTAPEISPARQEWSAEMAVLKKDKAYDYSKLEGSEYIRPQLLMKLMSEMLGDNDIITTEVGQNQIWAANHVDISKDRKLLSSGGLGTMGYGLPCAVGAKIARSDCQVIDISGDGSFQMSIQELATIAGYGVAVKVLLLNNSKLGMVREVQSNMFDKRYCATCLEGGNPDFMKLAEAYGIPSRKITRPDEVSSGLKEMLDSEGPFILECVIDKDEETLG